MHPRHRVPRRGALQPCQGASTAARKSWEMFGCRFGRLLLRSRGGAGPEKEEEKPEQTEARQTEGRMRLTAATRTVAGRALRCRFGGHVRGEFPVRAWRVASRLSFFLHWPTHPHPHHPTTHIFISTTTTGHFTIVQPVRVAVITNGFVPKTRALLISAPYWGQLATAVARRRLGLQTSGKKATHTHTHTHTLDSPIPTTPKAYMKVAELTKNTT